MINVSPVIVNLWWVRDAAKFIKLQFIFYHHLILHIENALQSDVTVISLERRESGLSQVTSCCIIKVSVWPICSPPHTVRVGVIFTEGWGCRAEVESCFNQTASPAVAHQMNCKASSPDTTRQWRRGGSVSTVLYCVSQLCWALTRLQRKLNSGQTAALLHYCVIMGADRGLFLLSQGVSCRSLCTYQTAAVNLHHPFVPVWCHACSSSFHLIFKQETLFGNIFWKTLQTESTFWQRLYVTVCNCKN